MEKSFSSEWICLRCFPHRTRTSVRHFCTYEAYAWHLSIRIGVFLLPWKKAQPLVLQWPHAWWPTPGNFQACSSHTNYTALCKPRHQVEKPQQLYEQAARGVMTWGWREGPSPFHSLIVNRLNDVNWFEKKTGEAVLIATKIPLTSSVYCSRWLFITRNVITSLKN